MGLIDTVSAGFRLVQRRLWLMLLPLLLDLWLWLGPQFSIKRLVNGLLALWSPATLPPDLVQMTQGYQQLLVEVGQRFNLLWLLSNGLTWMDGLLPRLSEPASLVADSPSVVDVPPLALLLWVPLLLVAGLGLGSAFLTSLAWQLQAEQPATGEEQNAGPGSAMPEMASGAWLRRGLRAWALVLIYGALLLVLVLVASLVFSLALSVVMLIAPGLGVGLGTFGLVLVGWVAIWFYLMLYFVVAAVVWDGVGLPQALWRSANVVMHNFWATVGLVLLTNIILSGFGLIWQRLAQLSPWGTLAGIVGNAFLLTGLAAARLVFYGDRHARWQEALAAQRATPDSPPGPSSV